MESTNRRKYPRVPVNQPADFTSEGRTHRTRALKLGGGGLFLGITQRIAPGTELTVRFRPAKHLPTMKAKARVCYQIPDRGVGIEFTEIKPEHRQMILRLIHHRVAEKRRFPRAPFVAQIEHEEGVFISFSRDISVGGMFIETTEPFTPGSSLQVRFHLDDGGPIVIASAEVRYVVEKLGIGVEFTYLELTDRNRIGAYVAKAESTRQ